MLRSLFAGVSGMRAHQQMMDVVGNNIANVNTTGFKSSSAIFEDLLSQVLSGAGAASQSAGGTNPAQVGLGTKIAGITTTFTQGASQVTGRSLDIAIQGDGFLVVEKAGQQLYSRNGSLNFDEAGNLVTVDGAFVSGWAADPVTHAIDTQTALGKLSVSPGQILAPAETTEVSMGKMLSADAAIGGTAQANATVYDSQGQANELTFTYTKTAANTWSCAATDQNGTALGTATLNFSAATGELSSTTPATYNLTGMTPAANWPDPITINFGDPTVDAWALKEYGGTSTVEFQAQNGSEAGTLQSFAIASSGIITGVFSNGRSQAIGQIALATFNNPAGLEKAGNSMYRMSANSGTAQIGAPGNGGRGDLSAGSLEMSNVDLSQEFTNLIIAQRGFQANSKVITTSDELLQTLLSLK